MIIAIDGIDGTGKGTQSKMLEEYLTEKGFKAEVVSFPIYSSFFGKMVSEYLNGAYGSLYSINPKLASLLYAQDRQYYFQTKTISTDEIIILDRYVNSNIAHHASKIDEKDRKIFINWIIELEYNVNKIPKPNISFILDLQVDNSIKNVARKNKREYTESTHDLHESNIEYLVETRKVFLSLADQPDTHLIECDINGVLRNQDDIAKQINSLVDLLLKN